MFEITSYPMNGIKTSDKASGIPRPSLVDSMLTDYESSGVIDKEYEITMQYVGGAMYGGVFEVLFLMDV